MRYTIDDIRQMPEGQTFDCKSFHIEPKALANTIVATVSRRWNICKRTKVS